jgi:hypothetical protein
MLRIDQPSRFAFYSHLLFLSHYLLIASPFARLLLCLLLFLLQYIYIHHLNYILCDYHVTILFDLLNLDLGRFLISYNYWVRDGFLLSLLYICFYYKIFLRFIYCNLRLEDKEMRWHLFPKPYFFGISS